MNPDPKTSHQAYGLSRLNSKHAAIRQLKRQYPTAIHGNKFWASSYLLMEYFAQEGIDQNERVLELGCGWALASIYLNKTFGCHVCALDADPQVFPYANLHADINNASISTLEASFEDLDEAALAQFDTIIAADICFWEPLSETVFELIEKALDAGVKRIVIADPAREPFLNIAQRCEDEFYAELMPMELSEPKARGVLMLIENG